MQHLGSNFSERFYLRFAKDLGCWGTLLLLSGLKHTLNQPNLVLLGRDRGCS